MMSNFPEPSFNEAFARFFPYAYTKEGLAAEIKECINKFWNMERVRFRRVGNKVWAVVKNKDNPNTLFLFDMWRGMDKRWNCDVINMNLHGEFTFKEYSCPPDYVKMCEWSDPAGKIWARRFNDNHDAKMEKKIKFLQMNLQVGDVVEVDGIVPSPLNKYGAHFIVTSKKSLRFESKRGGYTNLRIPKRLISKVVSRANVPQ